MNRLLSTIQKLRNARILDYIYPAYCHLCEQQLTHGQHLCTSCAENLPRIEPPFCSQCGECFDGQLPQPFSCPNCSQLDLGFEFARAALHSEAQGRQLIHDFKYSRKTYLAPELARLAQLALSDNRFSAYRENGRLVPVPLFWRRQRQRRFNQSEKIAQHLSSLSNIPMATALKRTRDTETQTHFNRKKRLKNLKNAFCVTPKKLNLIDNQNIILIDDVFTTGSTANECARTLIEHGARRVAVLTVLRG